jgi:DNA-binding XRE family transcriptional regulator
MATTVAGTLGDARALLEFVEERLELGIWTWELGTNELSWSLNLFRILGLDPRSTVPSFDLYSTMVHPEDRLDFSEPAVVATTGRLKERNFRIVRPTGELRWVRSCGAEVYDKEGHLVRVIGFAMDTTDQRRASNSEATTDGLMDAVRLLVDGWVWRTAPDGSVEDELDWWRSVQGAHPPGVGWAREQYVHPDDRKQFRNAWTKAIADRSPYRGKFRFQNADKGYVSMESFGMPVIGPQGELSGWVGITVAAEKERTTPLAATEVSGALVRAARGYYGWSIADLAEASGLSFSTIRRIETEKGHPVGEAYLERAIAALSARGASFRRDNSGRVSVVFTEDSGDVE